jgi:purine-binding chemotaxis protein CheW
MRDEKQKIKRFLTMRFSGELFGIDIENVRDIMLNVRIEKPHGFSGHITGIFNKGNILVPIIDLCGKLGIRKEQNSENSYIVLAEVENGGEKTLLGFAVGSGLEALEVTADNITLHENNLELLEGRAVCGHKSFKILKLNNLCSSDEIKAFFNIVTPVMI